MASPVTVRCADIADAGSVGSILREAAVWLDGRGMSMWRTDELDRMRIDADVSAGMFRLAEIDGRTVGAFRFQLEDREFWPDVPQSESAFIHRLAVRRDVAGGQVSNALLSWARDETVALGRRYLRLDCEAARPRLRQFYERFGFRHHSDRQVGPYFVARYEIDLGRSRVDSASVTRGPGAQRRATSDAS